MTLEKDTRDAIGRTVRALRELFEDEFGKQASGRFGIRSAARADASDADGLSAWLDPLESLSLTPAEYAQRDELVHALNYLTSEGNEPGEAVARLIREAAFTAVNRLLAVRVAEAIGVLPAVLSAGRQSAGFKQAVGDLFPGLANDENAYWTYLQIAGDELAPGVPRLFDRRYPTSAFVPSRVCVDEALALLTAEELAGAWIEPETLGWGYQFFNGDDVKQMRDASSAPRNSRELAVRNQFFTPRYVVDWLVQNTLGRRLRQAGYDLDLPLLVGEIGDEQPLALEDVRVLDPAVGSGHFLLGSYDLLEQAWLSTGVPPDQAAAKILPALFGIDIDPRAAQVAQAVLLLRGRRSAPNAELIPPSIVTAVALPQNRDMREQAFGSLTPAARHFADELTDALENAPVLGSLTRVEKPFTDALSSHAVAPRLSQDATEEAVLRDLRTALETLLAAAASPEKRLFSAEAGDALEFLSLSINRYDAVLMNPPFGSPVDGTKQDLRKAYPNASNDLYAAFVARGIELTRPGGYVGAITSRTGFFQSRSEKWRRAHVVPHLRVMLDLGLGVMHDAMVEAAAYVLGRDLDDSPATFLRVPSADSDYARAVRSGSYEVFQRPVDALSHLPGASLAYWVDDRSLEAYSTYQRTDASFTTRQGLATGNDQQFVRLWWEVNPGDVGRARKWVPYVKGGEFSPFFTDIHLVVNWDGDGRDIKERLNPKTDKPYSNVWMLKGTEAKYFFRPALTWPRRARSLCLQPLPRDCIFSVRSQALFHNKDDLDALAAALAWANAGPTDHLAKLAVSRREYPEFVLGVLDALPLPELDRNELHSHASRGFQTVSALWAAREESLEFQSPVASTTPMDVVETLNQVQADLDAAVARNYGYAPSQHSKDLPDEFLKTSGSARALSFLVGCAFGRWRVGQAKSPASGRDFSTAWDPLTFPDAADGPSVLVENGHPDSLVATLRGLVDGLAATPELADAVDFELREFGSSLEDFIGRTFFDEHLTIYSRSSRRAPIYWPIGTPSGGWRAWVYYPRLSREGIFALANIAKRDLDRLTSQAGQLGTTDNPSRQDREKLEAIETTMSELEQLYDAVLGIAESGWNPTLDDGVLLNATPFASYIAHRGWRSEVAETAQSLQKGEYTWATVQRDFFEKHR